MTRETAEFLLDVLRRQYLDPTAPDLVAVAERCARATAELVAVIERDAPPPGA